MKYLLLVAHGSRRHESNSEVSRLTATLRDLAGDRFDGIEHAFLEIAEPAIPDAIEACVQAGACEIVVLPYFLAAGRHVQDDIPVLVEQKQDEHPGVCIRITPHLGTTDRLPEILLNLAD